MPAVLRYVRSTLKSPRTGQRVRLQATVPADTPEVFNLTSWFGNYARAVQREGNIQFAYTHDPVPFSYEHERAVTSTGDCSSPRFCFTPRQRIHLVYHCPDETKERTSDDDGLTWSGEVDRFSGCKHPDIACDAHGTILRAAHETATGKITATRQYPGEANPGSPFFFQDSSSSDLLVEDDTFRIVADLRGLWWLHYRPDGGGATEIRYSADDGESWAVTSGSVTGITGGTHPGLAAGTEGTMWAWAYLAGEIAFSRRAAGEVDWSSPVSVQDHLGVDLAVKDIPSSMAHAYEGPGRLILATIMATHIGASDHWSADEGASFKRFLGT